MLNALKIFIIIIFLKLPIIIFADDSIFLNYNGDIGKSINNAFIKNPNGGKFVLPKGKLKVSTQINLDILNTYATVTIIGYGNNAEGLSNGSTLLDAKSLSADVTFACLRSIMQTKGREGYKLNSAAQ